MAVSGPEGKAGQVVQSSDSSSCSSRAGNPGNGEVQVAIPADIDSDEADVEVFSRRQVKNLLWIDQSTRHKKALEFWKAQDALCTRRVDSKQKQSLAVKNEVYQLIGFYSVFQGVLLTAVSQSNLLHCNNWWSAFSLSALASFVALIGIGQKFLTVYSLERTIESEKISRQIYVLRGQKLGTPNYRELKLDFNERRFSGQFRADILQGFASASTTMRTEIYNKTGQVFELKEGNAGSFSFLKRLDAYSNVSIKVDLNATYREYMVATGKKGKPLILTSDDLNEYKVINIEVASRKPITYKSVNVEPRRPGLPKGPEASGPGDASTSGDGDSSTSHPPAPPVAEGDSHPSASARAGDSSTSDAGTPSTSHPLAPPVAEGDSHPSTSVPPEATVPPVRRGLAVEGSKPALGISNEVQHVPFWRRLFK